MTPEFHRAHNLYVIELTGVNSLLSKYQYHILPQLLQVDIQKKKELKDQVLCLLILGYGTITNRNY